MPRKGTSTKRKDKSEFLGASDVPAKKKRTTQSSQDRESKVSNLEQRRALIS